MNKLTIFILIFLFSISLRLWDLNRMGRTWDEQEYVEQGYKMIEFFRKGDFDNSYFYTTYDHPPLVKYLYGLTAHLDLKEVLPNGQPVFNYDFTYSRILSAIFFSLGAAITFLIGYKLFSPLIGVISGVILAMLPFSLGLSQLVTAESFKIFIYPLAIYSYAFLIQKFTWKRVLIAGIITGIALQIKQSNFLLIPMLGLFFFLQYKNQSAKTKAIFIKTRIKAIILIFLTSIVVFFLMWPQALLHLKEVIQINDELWSVRFSSKFWQITLSPPEVFFGKLMITPFFYYFVYFFITIPILILILFFVGTKRLLKGNNLNHKSIFIWFVLPFALSMYSWRQHGLRYIIEIYPAIALISAVGFESAISKYEKKGLRKLVLFLPIIFYLSLALKSINPYYLDYFNELVGGVNTVYKYKLFQTGWWGEGLREAGIYLKNSVPQGSRIALAISPEHALLKSENLNYYNWSVSGKYDYVVVNNYHVIRDGFDDSEIKKRYAPVYFVRADQAVLATVYKHK